ncbi:tyrosine-type recombinase/integrase [candidate division CSSED10-310 bacterium]|uniref:Tyrosine-type recombinase/integrase n=1 Tax=candidate division CSSED10-310 bacterium TaxID=2855610 RepID=A0ABV6Z3W9_UNCC1
MTPLRQKMLNSMKLRRFSPNTEEAYISAVLGLAKYHMKSPDVISQKEIEDYILYLITDRKLSQGSCHVAIAGIRFFYNVTLGNRFMQIARGPEFCNLPYSKKETHLPQILSKKELELLFGYTKNLKHRALLMTTYSAGLRVSEVVNLKVTDIESDRMMIRVEQGKGKKDRYTILSTRLLQELRKYYRHYNPISLLFPGKSKNKPLSRHGALNIYQQAKKKSRYYQRQWYSYASSLLCNPSNRRIL